MRIIATVFMFLVYATGFGLICEAGSWVIALGVFLVIFGNNIERKLSP